MLLLYTWSTELCQVEQQNLRPILCASDNQLLLVADGGAVPLFQAGSIQLHRTACHLEPGVASVGECMLNRLFSVEERDVERDILVHGDSSVLAVACCNQPQPSALLLFRESLLFITRLDAFAFGQDPNLEQVHGIGFRGIELAVQDAGAGAHSLGIARTDDGPVPQTVLVLQCPLEHIRDDLHVAMWM